MPQGSGVDAVSPHDVWFTGMSQLYYSGTSFNEGYVPFVLRWDGRSFGTVMPPSGLLPDYNQRGAGFISLDSAADGWMSGGVGPFLCWFGGHWSVTPAIVPPHPRAGLVGASAVASVSPANAWAAGGDGTSAINQGVHGTAVVAHWDGRQWTIARSPAPDGPDSVLEGLSVVSPQDIWAVGWQGNQPKNAQTALIEHWNGRRWDIVPAPGGAQPAVLTGISADSASDAWAAGSQVVNGVTVPLTEHWNGTAWSAVASSLPPGQIPYTGGNTVYAASPTDAWAVEQTAAGSVWGSCTGTARPGHRCLSPGHRSMA